MHSLQRPQRRALGISLGRLSSTIAMAAAVAAATTPDAAAQNIWTAGSTTDFTWDNGANWSLTAKPGALDDVLFPTPIPDPGLLGGGALITLGAAELANSLAFNDSYSLTGGDLTLTTGNITVAAGALATLTSNLGGTNGLTKLGDGTLILNAANGFTGPAFVSAGTLQMDQAGALGGAGAVSIATGGTLVKNFGGDFNRALNLSGGTFAAVSGNVRVNGTITLGTGTDSTIHAQGDPQIVFLGGNTGSANIVTGSGNLTLNGPATGTGVFVLENTANNLSGTITLGNNVSLENNPRGTPFNGRTMGTADVVFQGFNARLDLRDGGGGNSGVLAYAENNVTVQSNPARISVSNGDGSGVGNRFALGTLSIGSTSLDVDGGDNYSLSFASATLTGDASFNPSSAPLRIVGNVTEDAAGRTLTKNGTGRMTIDGRTAYTGVTTVNNGTLHLANTSTVTPNAVQGAVVNFGGSLQASVGVNGGSNALGTSAVTLNGGALRITPAIATPTLPGQTAGLEGSYYNQGVAIHNNNTTGVNYLATPNATRVDDDLSFRFLSLGTNVGSAEGVPLGVGTVGTNVEQWAAKWNGLLTITNGGTYTFVSSSDDATAVFIDGVQIITNEGGHDFPGGGHRSTPITLTSGLHTVTVKLTQGTGGGGIVFAYEGPDQPTPLPVPFPKDGFPTSTLVPASVLSHADVTSTIANAINVSPGSNSTVSADGADVVNTGTMEILSNSTLNIASLTAHSFTQSGATTIDGSVTINTDTAHGTLGNITAGPGSSLVKTGRGNLTIAGTSNHDGGTFITTGTLLATPAGLGTGDVSNDGAIVINQATGTAALSAATFGTGAWTKTGAGTLALNGGSSAAGTFLVAEGALGGTGAFGGTVTVAEGAAIAGSAGNTFNVGSLALLPGATASLVIGSPTLTPLVNSTGGLSFSQADLQLTAAGPVTAGTTRLFDYAGAPLSNGAIGGLNVASTPGGAFYYAVVNNTVDTSVDLAVEAFGAANTWTGATDGTWAPGDATNWTGAYANGQQVTFGDGPTNRALTGAAVAPQRINLTSGAGNDYTFANPITGTVAGGIHKSGGSVATFTGGTAFAGPIVVSGGSLVLAGPHSGTGAVEISGGTLRLTNTSLATPNDVGGVVTVGAGGTVDASFGGARPGAPGASGSNSLGAAAVVLDGGTLILRGERYDTGAGGLTAQFYSQQVQRNARIEFGSLSSINALFNTSTPETLGAPNAGFTNAITDLNFPNAAFGNAAPFAAVGVAAGDNIMATWKGKFDATLAGTNNYSFLGRSDDGLMLFVDGQLVINRNNFQGNSLSSGAIDLAQGSHDLFVAFYEGGGGAGIQVFETADGDALDLADLTAAQPHTVLGNAVDWTASSTIAADNTYGVTMGTLAAKTAGTTLTTGRVAIAGQPSGDGLIRFTNTRFDAPGTFTLNAQSDIALGTLADNGNTLIVSKTGPANLILDSGTASDANGITFDIQSGRLVASNTVVNVNPLGSASIQLNGEGTVLQLNHIESIGSTALFANSVAVNQNARIESMRHGGGGDIALGSAGNTLSIAAGKTLEIQATSGANLRIDSPISGDGASLRVTASLDPGQGQAFLLLNAANTFTGSVTLESGTNVRLDNANAMTSASFVDLAANGRIEFFANNSYSTAFPRIVSRVGSFFRINGASNPAQTIGSGTLEVGPGRILEFQTGNPLTGGGTVTHAPGSTLALNTGVTFPLASTQVGLRASDVRPLDVVRVVTTLTGAGDGNVANGWGAMPQGAILQIFGGNRNIANTNVQELNGQIITNDGAGRNIDDGNRIDIGPLGGVIAATSGQTLSILDNLMMDAGSGKLTIGANIPLDSRFSAGTVAFAHGTVGDYTGTTASAAAAIDVIAGAVLEGRADADGSTGFGTVNASNLGVNLARGTLRALQVTTNNSTAGTYSVSVGKVFATGAATLHVNRNTGNTGVITEMRIGAPIERAAGASIGLLSQNNTLGVGERIRFGNNADAPARLTIAGPATIDMVDPHFINVSNNLGSFVDYDSTQDPATGPGFVNAAYTGVTLESGLLPGTIADVTAAIALTGNQMVAAARLQAAVSGAFTLTSETGGFIVTSGSNVNQTISAKLAAAPGREFVLYSGGVTGGIHNLNGTITSDSGLVKFGPRTLSLGADNSATLVGDISINESSLVVSADNRLGAATNRVVLNGGNLRPSGSFTTNREILVNSGGGQLTNDGNRVVEYGGNISGEGALTINSVNGNNGINRFTNPGANSFEGGLIIANGILEFGRNDQLGAAPSPTDFDRGHVVINEGGGTNATFRLISGAGTVVTTGRQFTILGGNARFDVAGAGDVLEIDNDIRGNGGGINKNGPGTLLLSNPDGNGFTGNTLVNAGTLLLSNSTFTATGTGTVTVNSGATLGGNAIIEGSITGNTGAILAPGLPGINSGAGSLLGQGGLTLNADSIFAWTLAAESTASPGVNFDVAAIDFGTLTIASGVDFQFDFAGTTTGPIANAFWGANQTWNDIIAIHDLAQMGSVGAFDIDNSAWAALGEFALTSDSGGVDLVWTAVPEPGTAGLITIALGTLLGLRRNRRKAS